MFECPACGSAREHDRLYEKNGCEIIRCSECGLGRAIAGRFDPGAYYTSAYFCGTHADGYYDYRKGEPVLRREFKRTIEFVRRYKSSGRLLEIGCAYGFLLKEAERYFDVVGLELSAEAAEHARSSGLQIVCGAAESDAASSVGHFDVILMLDVVEHLQDPRAVLGRCARQLRPDGIVMLTTGDFSSALARASGMHWRLMTPPQHLWFFTQQSLRRLGTRVGLEIEHIDHPWKFVPLSLIAFQLRRMLHMSVPGTAISHMGVPVNLFDAMRVVLRRSPPQWCDVGRVSA